jgi:hypothetical protein
VGLGRGGGDVVSELDEVLLQGGDAVEGALQLGSGEVVVDVASGLARSSSSVAAGSSQEMSSPLAV